MITNANLEKYNKTNNEPLKNARNAVSGAIRNLDPKETAKRNNVSTTFVKDIKYRKHRLDISKNYNW